jgi:hypothetical protein
VAGGLFVLVAPTAVVRHGLALKHGGVVARVAGVIDEHHHRFALHVEAGVVVPLVFGGCHAVASKYQRRAFDFDRRLFALGQKHKVGAVFQGEVLAVARDGSCRIGLTGNFY